MGYRTRVLDHDGVKRKNASNEVVLATGPNAEARIARPIM